MRYGPLAGVVLVLTLGIARAEGGRLVVVDHVSARGKARVVYKFSGSVSGLPIGSGPDDISADVTVRVDGMRAGYTIPAGAYDGEAGWLRNDANRGALFINR